MVKTGERVHTVHAVLLAFLAELRKLTKVGESRGGGLPVRHLLDLYHCTSITYQNIPTIYPYIIPYEHRDHLRMVAKDLGPAAVIRRLYFSRNDPAKSPLDSKTENQGSVNWTSVELLTRRDLRLRHWQAQHQLVMRSLAS